VTRRRLRAAVWVIAVCATCGPWLGGCELVASVGSLRERSPEGGGQNSTRADGAGSSGGTDAGSAGATGQDATAPAPESGPVDMDSAIEASESVDGSDDGSGGHSAQLDAASQDADVDSGVGVLGSACSSPAALACAGNAQKVTLICQGVWMSNGTCGSGQLCDSAAGINRGTCQPIDPPCASASPGGSVCSDATTIVQCGPDLVFDTPVGTCTNQACVAGACVGSCTPASTRCSTAADGSAGNAVETCSSTGTFSAPVACNSSVCVSGACTGTCAPDTSQCSGNAAVQSCGSDGMPGTAVACKSQACVQSGSTASCEGVCTPSTTRCTSDTQVETCSTSGQWGTATTCTDACVGAVDAVGGGCGGVCVPGTTECTSDTQVETCSTSGQWSAATTCTYACVGTVGAVGGSCGGVCVPGVYLCVSGDLDTCGTDGQPSYLESCGSGCSVETDGTIFCP
jgi:hypothetical protein